MSNSKCFSTSFLLILLTINILTAGIVVDHTCTNADLIPQIHLDSARTLDIFFAHREIGDTIMLGIVELAAEDSSRFFVDTAYEPNIGWFTNNSGIAHAWSGLNCRPDHKCSTFNYSMREKLIASQVDIAFLMFYLRDFICLDWWGEMPADTVWFNHYLPIMDSLEADYPEVSFVWWTAPLSDRWGNQEKHIFNTYVRDYCLHNDKILFDLAAIESHDPQGEMTVDVEGFEAMYPDYAHDGTFPNELGQRRIANALWWLFSEIAGWNGGIEEESINCNDGFELRIKKVCNGTNQISYNLPVSGYTKLAIYDIAGREVAILVEGVQAEGQQSVTWIGTGPGIYFYLLETRGGNSTGKFIVVE